MPSHDSAPYNGDDKLWAKESRAYFLYGWQEIRANREPDGVQQAIPQTPRGDDSRSPYRIYADTVMGELIPKHIQQPAQIIDIGCGGGDYARLFIGYEGTYHGVDAFHYDTWQSVEAESQEWELNVKFYHTPAEQLGDLPINSNFSLSSSALEHVDDPDAAICGLAKLTQAGGYGLHIVPGPWSLIMYGKHGWRRFSASRLQALFEDAGFEVVEIRRLGGLPSSLLHLIWITGLQGGNALQTLTLSALPFMLYRVNSKLAYEGMRTKQPFQRIYRALLSLALKLDRILPYFAVGYAVLVRRASDE